ncbi:MAG: hypothetical protein NUV72_02800, partial [Bauldia sp.]|nr:hypothetical protein [Bauldia sp.]
MRHLIRGLFVSLIASAVVAAAGAALAESRLFTVRTDAPGVTIVQAVRNGVQLPVAGQSGGATFFRIDNPSGPVPCSNRILFTASNGQGVDASADLCANNWELVIGVAGGGGGGTVPGAGQPVVITTDDPNVTITEAFLRGKPVPIDARQGRYVRILAPAEAQGIECQRDLGLALSDGRRIARLVDICQSNFVVVVALVGGPRPPPPPPTFLAVVEQPVIQPLPRPPPSQPVPPPSAGLEIVSGLVWMFNASTSQASLVYAFPNTEASEFTAVCPARSSQTTITLDRAPPGLMPGAKVLVRFTAGDFARTYTATASPVSELSGHSHPVLQISTNDPLWPALIRESVVLIAVGQMPPYGLSLAGSAAKAKQFLAVCSPPAVVPAAAAAAPG